MVEFIKYGKVMLVYVRDSRLTGSVLIIVLIFISIISLLAITAMRNSIVEQKISANWYRDYQLLMIAEYVLQTAETTIQTANCITDHVISTRLLIENSDDFWFSRITCQGESLDRRYQYIVERLIVSPCVQIQQADIVGAQYFRVSVRVSDQDNQRQHIIQSTYVVEPIESILCDSPDTIKSIVPGRQSWRQLT